MKHLLPSLAAAGALALAGCNADHPGAPTPVEVRVIRSATSFGFCVGYCRSALEITPERISYRLFDDRTRQPELVQSAAVSAVEWQGLEATVRRQQLEALPAVIGCPDCADGGAESLEVVAQDWSHSVTFDRGVAIPELQPLLDRVRAIRDRLDRELRAAAVKQSPMREALRAPASPHAYPVGGSSQQRMSVCSPWFAVHREGFP